MLSRVGRRASVESRAAGSHDRPAVAPVRRVSSRTRGPTARGGADPSRRLRVTCVCASRVGVVGGGNSAAQAAIWLARGDALVTLLHRRADSGETMSDYLIHDVERYGVAVRDRSEIAALAKWHPPLGLAPRVKARPLRARYQARGSGLARAAAPRC